MYTDLALMMCSEKFVCEALLDWAQNKSADVWSLAAKVSGLLLTECATQVIKSTTKSSLVDSQVMLAVSL